MTGYPRFQVDHDQLHAHADTVGDLANRLGGLPGTLPDGPADGSLGSFVQFLTTALGGAMTKVTGSVQHASGGVTAVSAALHRSADSYQGTDERNATRLRWENMR